jgi:hypothetical protein
VEIRSLAGAECRLRNPWGDGPVTLYRDMRKSETAGGAMLHFPTRKDENIVVVPANTSPETLRRRLSA